MFTHRPVQDICANAPRDYTQVKMLTSSMKNNRMKIKPVECMILLLIERDLNLSLKNYFT